MQTIAKFADENARTDAKNGKSHHPSLAIIVRTPLQNNGTNAM